MTSALERHVRFLGAAVDARRPVLVGPVGADPAALQHLAGRLGITDVRTASAEEVFVDAAAPTAVQPQPDLIVLVGGALWSAASGFRLAVGEGDRAVPEDSGCFVSTFPLAPASGSGHVALAVPAAGPKEGARLELDAIGRARREVRPSQPIPEDGGGLLFALASARRASRILEIGTGEGAAALWLASAMGPRGRMVTVERDSARWTAARGRVRRAGLDDRVDLRLGEAERIVPRLEGRFDFVLLDADVETRTEHLALVLERCARGALVASRSAVGQAAALARYHATIRTTQRVRVELSVAAGDGLSLALLR